ncbi:diguanylate cyclase (GGDEF)-like protein [Marinobacterium halophilum]|uniref:diguanylate cyclase n=1 Tax=Marinobacterium halophilum TaxID=267374 RepID=A0A2P8EQJ5_9GAMM|nr:diguanylate cyclase [Marinobacterium halophilum]PSL11708.1 diguanylate cyclase (GGDEF)-like protein [Marinobacterium halophilum]
MQRLEHSIGTRLTLIISAIFGLYLIAVSAIGYVMYQQYQGFSHLASRQFDRAMAAAELTRDAEVIAAEVFEVMVGSRRSVSAGNERADNLANLYKTARERLDELDRLEVVDISARLALDRWQGPFFKSLGQLGQQLESEKMLQQAQLQRLDRIFLLLQQLPLNMDTPELQPYQHRFVSHALAALAVASSALSTERPGHIAQLERTGRQALQQLAALPLQDEASIKVRQKLQEALPEVFESRLPLLKSARATLATARHTRVLAQKLTGATFNYHLQLKASAKQAIAAHQGLIRHSLLGLFAASLALVAVTIGAVMYVRRNIVQRINRLSAAMQSHLHGRWVPIPQDGADEISEMGASFAVFVDARRKAELQLEEMNVHLQQMNTELERLSTTDSLTQTPNRRCFDQQLELEWYRALREGRTLSVVMADIDLFKCFNDTYGHQKGDECLQQVAQAMASQLKRSSDMIARYGGEEFILLLPGQRLEQAVQLAENLADAVRQLDIEHHGSPLGRVTVSLGVAAQIPLPQGRVEQLIHDADNALYMAKKQGRDQVCTGSIGASQSVT